MDRKTFLGAAVTTPATLLIPSGTEHSGFAAMKGRVVASQPDVFFTPTRDSVSFLLSVGEHVTEYSFYIDEHSTNLMGMFRAMCVAAEGEFVSRVVLPRGATPHV